MIRIESSKGRVLACTTRADLVDSEKQAHKRLARKHAHAVERTDASVGYNCHGLTFLARRAWLIESTSIQIALDDDAYQQVLMADVLPGDIVLYSSDRGDINHSGIVVEAGGSAIDIRVCSKWAYAGEFIHGLRDCPGEYGPQIRFYRCTR